MKIFKQKQKKISKSKKTAWREWLEVLIVVLPLVFVLRTYVFGLYNVPTGSAEPTILVVDYLFGNKFIHLFNGIKHGDCIIHDEPNFVYSKNSVAAFWQKYIGFGIPFLGLQSGPANWTKRVIGIPGDVIEGKIEDGKTAVYLNGKKLDESKYVNPYPLILATRTSGFTNLDNLGPFKMPSFLRKKTELLYFAYDPSKDLENQPFYKIEENELLRKPDGRLQLAHPGTPTYNRFGECIDEFGPIKIPKNKYWVMGDNRKNSMDSRYWGFLDRSEIQGKAVFVIFSLDTSEASLFFELIKHPIDFWKKVRWNRIFKFIK